MTDNQEKKDGQADGSDFLGKKVSRRRALSTGAKIAIGAGVVIVASGAGYYIGTKNGSAAATSTTSATTGSQATSSSSSLATVPLTYWTLTEAPQNIPIYNQWIDEYKALHPSFNWTFINYPDENTTYLPKLQAGVQAPSTLPDFALSWPAVASQLGDEGVFLPVDDFINNSSYFPDGAGAFYHPNVLNMCKDVKSGHIFTVPVFFNVDILYVNTGILSAAGVAPPTTWDEFDAAVKAVHNPPNVYGFATSFTSTSTGNGNFHFGAVMPTFGSHALDANLQVTFDSPETLEALNYWMSLYNTYAPPGKETLDEVTAATQFAAPGSTGQIAMFMGTCFRFAQQIGTVPAALQFTQCMSIPSGGGTIAPNGGPGGNMSSYGYALCNGSVARNEEAQAEDLMGFFLQPQNQLQLFTQTHYMITREDIWQNYQSEMQAADPTGKYIALLSVVRDASATAIGWESEHGVGPWATDFDNAVSTMLQSALLGQSTPEQAIQTAAAAMSASMVTNGYPQNSSSSS